MGAGVTPPSTDAPSHNIVSTTMLGVVGICRVVHVNERNNCQQCWRSSKEVMHSGTIILAIRVRRRFHEANIVVVSCKRRFAGHRTIEILRLLVRKVTRIMKEKN